MAAPIAEPAGVQYLQEEWTMRTPRRRGLVFALAGVCALLVITAHAAGTPQQQCQVTKNKAVGKYVACRQNVEAKLVASGNTDAVSRCGPMPSRSTSIPL